LFVGGVSVGRGCKRCGSGEEQNSQQS